MERIISEDLDSGISHLFHYDEMSDTATIETRQEVSDLIMGNKSAFNDVDERANWKGDMHLVASIPLTVYYDLIQRGIVNDKPKMKAWLNDPNNRFFRVRPGKI